MEARFFLRGIEYLTRVLSSEEARSLYREVLFKSCEKFGDASRAYQTLSFGIDGKNGTGSNFFFNNEVNLYLSTGKRIMNFQDMKEILRVKPDFFNGFYSDTTSLVVRSSKLSLKKNKSFLENIISQLNERNFEFSPNNPAIIDGSLRLDFNNANEYGMILDLNYVENDSDFGIKVKEVILGGVKKKILNKRKGVCRIFAWDLEIDAKNNNLVGSDETGRIVIIEKL